jgi:diguanylate cyclase
MALRINREQVDRMQSAMRKVYAIRYVSLEQHLDMLLHTAAETLNASRASIWRFERGLQRLRLDRFHEQRRATPPPSILERSVFPKYFDALKTAFVIDASDAIRDPRTCELADSYLRPLGVISLLDTPLRAFGAHIGVLCLEFMDDARKFEVSEQAFANAIATQISFAMERDELNQANANLVQRVLYDSVTHLPNAIFLRDQLDQALGEMFRGGEGIALLYADLDHFMQLCNSLGQQLANALLHALALRLQDLLPSGATVARAGDDDFAIILRSDNPIPDALALAKQIKQQMREPLSALGRLVHCSLSVGITARAQGDTAFDPESMLREGWIASRSARSGDGISCFERKQLAQATLSVELEQELRQALTNQEFEPHFQPIFDFRLRKIVGFEALMRWRNPQRGVLTPIEFIQVAQRTGLMIPIGMQLLRRTLADFSAFRQALGRAEISLSFNLTPSEFLQPELINNTSSLLNEFQIPAGVLSFEITEQVIISDLALAKNTLEQLHTIGVGVALDDFGTGYSALNYLRVLSVDSIKIDRSFVDDLDRNPRSALMMRSIGQLARNFTVNAIAEGVEWQEQFNLVTALQIDQAQGYLIARPTPASAITRAWLSDLERHCIALLPAKIF